MMARFSGIQIISPLVSYKNCVRVGHPLTKLSGSAHEPYVPRLRLLMVLWQPQIRFYTV